MFACKSQLVSVTVQVVCCSGRIDVRLLLATNNGRERKHGSSKKSVRTKPYIKHRHARLGYNTAWVLNEGVRESECSKAASAAPLAWVTQ